MKSIRPQITQWKKQLLDGGSSLFGRQQVHEQQAHTAREAELFEQLEPRSTVSPG